MVVAGLAIVGWVALTSLLVLSISSIGSPDEAANQAFIRQYAATGEYTIPSGLSPESTQIFHPRSVLPQGDRLAPGSFLGLVQAGAMVVRVFGVGAERFLLPTLGLIGLWALYLVVRRFWSRWWSLAAVALVAVHPAWFGQLTAPYLHNGAFMAMLLVSGWAILRLLERPTFLRSVVMGIVFGLTLFFRPVEALWTVPLVMVLLIARRLWWPLIVVGTLTVAWQLPWLLANRELYGSWLSSAYTPAGVWQAETGSATGVAPAKIFFTPPGGTWSWHWLSSVWWYLIVLPSPVSILALVALGRYLRRAARGVKVVKLLLLSLPIIFFLVYYGTWNLYPTSTSSQIGWFASYCRYWLPIYVAFCIGAVVAIQAIFTRRFRFVVLSIVFVTCGFATVAHANSGVLQRLSASQTGEERRSFILRQTEPSSLVIAGQQDKYLFTQRRVANRWPENEPAFLQLKTVVNERPVYLYGTANQYSERRLRSQLEPYGLTLGTKKNLGSETLWSIRSL